MKTALKILLAATLTTFLGHVEAAQKKSTLIVAPNGFSFDSANGISNRFITPNTDTFNDSVVFTFENPRDSEVTGSIYDLKGAEVARMIAGPTGAPVSASQSTLLWDGKMGGQTVNVGVYIYVIRSEDTVVSGTLVVVL